MGEGRCGESGVSTSSVPRDLPSVILKRDSGVDLRRAAIASELRLPASAVLRVSRECWGKTDTRTPAEEDAYSEETERAGLHEIV